MTILETLRAELEMQTENYNNAVRRATDLLTNDGARLSMHLGHNLASAASELSTIAGAIESIQGVIRYVESTETR